MLAGLPSFRTVCVGPQCLSTPQLVLWFGSFALFGVAFFRATAEIGRPHVDAATTALVGLQAAAALIMLTMICSGFEAMLLIVVAAQLGVLLPMSVGAPWIVLQSSAMGMLVLQQWSSPRSAAYWLLGSIGFQLFAYIIAAIAGREAEGRRQLARVNAELRATQELLAMSSKATERLRIARELHDLVGHNLTALHLHLETAKHLTQGRAAEAVTKAQSVSKKLLGDVREAVTALRDDQAIDVCAALRALCEGIEAPQVHLTLPDTLPMADPQRAQTLLRCAQELLTNAIKHARAQHLWLEVRAEGDEVWIEARDDGRGVEQVREGCGLLGMRERLAAVGGQLSIDSRRGAGFRVLVSLPAPGVAL